MIDRDLEEETASCDECGYFYDAHSGYISYHSTEVEFCSEKCGEEWDEDWKKKYGESYE